MGQMPEIVKKYKAIGFDVPEEYWPQVEAGVPWSEIMDEVPVACEYYGPANPLERLADWLAMRFGLAWPRKD